MLHPLEAGLVTDLVVAAELADHDGVAALRHPVELLQRLLWHLEDPAVVDERRVDRPGRLGLRLVLDVPRAVMRDRVRRVAPERLPRRLNREERADRLRGSVVAVEHHEAVRILRADRADRRAEDERELLLRESARLVDEIERQLLVRDAAVTLRELPPEFHEGLLRDRIGLQLKGLGVPARDGEARRAVQADLDVDAMPAPPRDRLVQVAVALLAHLRPVVRRDEVAVVHRQAREVEAPLRHPLEMLLAKSLVPCVLPVPWCPEEPEQVEAVPELLRFPRGGLRIGLALGRRRRVVPLVNFR